MPTIGKSPAGLRTRMLALTFALTGSVGTRAGPGGLISRPRKI